MKIYALRLKSNQDLRQNLKNFALTNQIQAGFILTAIGSLKQAVIRFADQPTGTIVQDKFEIVGLNGTVACSGVHLHIVVSDQTGKTLGGHLEDGCLIYTTAELILGEIEGLTFLRTVDQETGYQELEICESQKMGQQAI